jgi:hypothetical protein
MFYTYNEIVNTCFILFTYHVHDIFHHYFITIYMYMYINLIQILYYILYIIK